MPIYEYQCEACLERHEALQKMSDPKLVDCPACHEPKLKKMVTAAAFKLSGTGWYETDFKNSGKQPEKAPKSEAAGSDSSPVSGDKASTSTSDSAKKNDGSAASAANTK